MLIIGYQEILANSQYKTGQEISSQRGRIRRMDRMRGNADNWISGDLSQYKTGQEIFLRKGV